MRSFRPSLAALRIVLLAAALAAQFSVSHAADIPYGQNDDAGKYQNVGDTRIYYEIYGSDNTRNKPPLVLLHDSLHGSIADFAPYIPKLAEHFVVHAVSTRGHGRSGVGTLPYTYQLFADDAAAILRRVTVDVAAVIGFGDGAIATLALAGEHPHLVGRIVAVSPGRTSDGLTETRQQYLRKLRPDQLIQENPAFLEARRSSGVEPDRGEEALTKISALYRRRIYIPTQTIEQLQAPTLLVAADRDEYFGSDHLEELHRAIPTSILAIVPDVARADLIRTPAVWNDHIFPFLLAP